MVWAAIIVLAFGIVGLQSRVRKLERLHESSTYYRDTYGR